MKTPDQFASDLAFHLRTAEKTKTQFKGTVQFRTPEEIIALEVRRYDWEKAKLNPGSQVLGILSFLTDAERVQVFDDIRTQYCVYCGKELQGKVCHCTNDE